MGRDENRYFVHFRSPDARRQMDDRHGPKQVSGQPSEESEYPPPMPPV